MYSITNWLDHVVIPARTFTIADNVDGTYIITPVGEVAQQGTPMSAANFNNMEKGILESIVLANWMAQMQRYANDDGLENKCDIITKSVTEAVSNEYITLDKNTAGYDVVPIVTSGSATVTVSNKQTNAFKYTTSAACTVMFIVRGGHRAPNLRETGL